MAGFHEVVATPAALDLLSARSCGDTSPSPSSSSSSRSPWRVSSTCFGHIQSDQLLQPLGHFMSEAASARYPALLAGDQVVAELKAIALDRSHTTEE